MEKTKGDYIYTFCYCEENIYKLGEKLLEEGLEESKLFAVFISNDLKAVPLFKHKEGPDPVVWDYHVILIESRDDVASLVYDFDVKDIGFPTDLETYTLECFQPCIRLKDEFQRKFRVIPISSYLRNFTSDRSHMKNKNGEWLQNPPSYPIIKNIENIDSNLFEEFVSMKNSNFGEILNEDQFLDKFS